MSSSAQPGWANQFKNFKQVIVSGALASDVFTTKAFSGGADAVKAVATLASTHANTVLQAVTGGTAGNSLTIAFASGGSGAGVLTHSGNAFTFTFQDGVTTVANFEAAVASSGAGLISVKTPGTQSNVLTNAADVFNASAYPFAGGLAAIKAALTVGTSDENTVLEAYVAGAAGNSLTLSFAGGGTGTGQLSVSGNAVSFAFADGVTTVTNFETAVAALSGAAQVIDVRTPGTGANILKATPPDIACAGMQPSSHILSVIDLTTPASATELPYPSVNTGNIKFPTWNTSGKKLLVTFLS